MCGRLTLTTPDYEALAAELGAGFSAEDAATYFPRFNVAPTQWHPVVHLVPGGRRLDVARWGLVNRWAADRNRAAQQINARSESVDTTKAYKEAFQSRRCIVPATGFYEWTKHDRQRVPHYITSPNGQLLLMAGLYEFWNPKEGETEATFTILTTEANGDVQDIHHRMPVLLSAQDSGRWLNPNASPQELRGLFKGTQTRLTHHEVTQEVNSAGPDHEGLTRPTKNLKQGSLF